MRQRTIWLGTAAAGAAAAFLFDPISGRRRRALIRDKAVRTANETSDAVEKLEKDTANRSSGLVALLRRGRLPTSWDVLQNNWAPATRALAGASGAGLLATGMARRDSFLGLGLALGGAALLARALTNLPLSKMAQRTSERRRGAA